MLNLFLKKYRYNENIISLFYIVKILNVALKKKDFTKT